MTTLDNTRGHRTHSVTAEARALAAQLSALFDTDVGIVTRLNAAQRRLAAANERLRSGLAPDAFGLIYDGAAPVGHSQIAELLDAPPGGDEPGSHAAVLQALQDAHWQVHHGGGAGMIALLPARRCTCRRREKRKPREPIAPPGEPR